MNLPTPGKVMLLANEIWYILCPSEHSRIWNYVLGINFHLMKISQCGKWDLGVALHTSLPLVLEGSVFNQQVWSSRSVLTRPSGCCPGYS